MIVNMQHVTVLSTVAGRGRALSDLQELGVLHLDAVAGEADDLRQAEKEVAAAEEALRRVAQAAAQPETAARNGKAGGGSGSRRRAPAKAAVVSASDVSVKAVQKLGQEHEALDAEIEELEDEIARYAAFGEFNPADAARLTTRGVTVQLFRAPVNAQPQAEDGGLVQVIAQDDDHVLGVAFGAVELGDKVERLPLPAQPLSAMRRRHAEATALHTCINSELAGMEEHASILRGELTQRQEIRDFLAAKNRMGADGGIVWLTGFCPAGRVPALLEAAQAGGWAMAVRDPAPDEEPPTIIDPPAPARPVKGLFKMLSILPGYRETDISVVFYAFFALFFAMLVGDAGYGAIMLIGTLLLRRKLRRAPSAPFTLMTVFSGATIVWGVLTATYFGLPSTKLPSVLQHPVAAWLGDQENIMQVCFFIGALHLSIARLWNAAELLPSRKALAEIGWVGIVWTMYAAACSVTITGFAMPSFMPVVAVGSALLIILFMLGPGEFKTGGINLAMLPLSIISCLGDVISYVRLFAVGVASVKVAENFNAMALNLEMPLWFKIPCVVLILVFGHGLNLLMAGLSILVHAVRLNTLEFSNHKGITWSGFPYRPFRRRTAPAAATE